jgi:uncharacterized protein (TIGR03437 family)
MLLLLLATPVRAQFTELAATDDGKQLFFTSQLLLKGAKSSSSFPETRLYRSGSNGVEVFAERGPLAPDWTFGSSDGVSHPSVSGDGSVVGFTFNDVCSSATNCSETVNRVEVRGRETLDLGPGVVQVSRNGHWAAVTNVVYDFSQPMVVSISVESTLIDLSTGQRTVPPGPPPYHLGQPSTFTLASDGTLLLMRPDLSSPPGIGGVPVPVFGLWKQGQFTPVPLPSGDNLAPFAVSDDAGAVLAYGYSANPQSAQSRIVTISMASGKATTIFETKDPSQTPIFMAASNNGQRVLYRVATPGTSGTYLNGPSFVWDAATGTTTPVPLATGELGAAGTLSGGGSVAFLATTQARIVKFDLASKTASPLFPQTPYCDDPGPLAGGSRARLRCPFPTPVAAKEGEVLYDGEPLPLLYSVPGEIGVQIPWQWSNFMPSTLSFRVASDSPFEASQPLGVYDAAPVIVPVDPGQSSLFGIKIVKGDWSGLLNSQPLPGDIVYIYMTGLGWTESPETTGVAASLTKANPIRFKLSCRFLPQSQPAELLFAGVAPGMIGIYQTAFRIPSDAGDGPLTGIECVLATPIIAASFGPGIPVRGLMGSGSYGFGGSMAK